VADFLQTPAGLAVLALGSLALAALGFAQAWSEWRRSRTVSFLCVGAAFGVVALGEALAIADGALFLLGSPLPPALAPVRRGMDGVAGLALSFGLAFGVVHRRRALGVAFGLGLLLVIALSAAGHVTPAGGRDVQWALALQAIGALALGGAAVLLWRSDAACRAPYSAGLALLSLCVALGGHLTPLPSPVVTPPGLLMGYAVLPVAGLALLVYGMYAGIVAEVQRRGAQQVALLREMADSHGAAVAGSIAAGVAHDMNGPLTAIVQSVDLALRAATPERREECTRRIGDQAWKLAHLAANLLGFARPSAEAPQPVDVRKLLDDTLQLLAYEIRHAHIDVSLDAGARLPTIEAAPRRLQHALVDLLRHAVRVSPERGAIGIRATSGEETVALRICYQGDAEAEGQAAPGLIWDHAGLSLQDGLALAVAREAIEEHGGALQLRSSEQGNTAEVWLPRRPGGGDEGAAGRRNGGVVG
jgi:signal transduction histidine kinase